MSQEPEKTGEAAESAQEAAQVVEATALQDASAPESSFSVGIISINMYSKFLNFACPLHTWAFQQFLRQNGINATVVDYKPIYYNNFDMRHPYNYYVKLCDALAKSHRTGEDLALERERRESLRDAFKELYEERETRYDLFQEFIDEHYIKTKETYDSDLLELRDPGFDCYVCATDVIWKSEPGFGFDRGFFLACKAMEGKWKASYAASRGVYFAEGGPEEREFLYYVDDIDAISVREKSLEEYLEAAQCPPAVTVLDPVLLHPRSFYEQVAVRATDEGPYLFLYYVMEQARDTLEQAVAYARAHNLKIIEVTDRPEPQGRLFEIKDVEVSYRYVTSPQQWLGYLMDAEVVFTNSFHATCFSILFGTNFFTGRRHGDKITNVLEIFGLEDRRFNAATDLEAAPEIDWAHVQEVMERKRKESGDFILGALHSFEGRTRTPRNYEWWKRSLTFDMSYRSGSLPSPRAMCEPEEGEIVTIDGRLAFKPAYQGANNGLTRLECSHFFSAEGHVVGWRVRFKVDNRWFWLTEDGTFDLQKGQGCASGKAVRVFAQGERIPYLDVWHIREMIVEAVWEPGFAGQQFPLRYNSGSKSENVQFSGDPEKGEVERLLSGSWEFRPEGIFEIPEAMVVKDGLPLAAVIGSDGELEPIRAPKPMFKLKNSRFRGWRVRVRINGQWLRLLKDGTFAVPGTVESAEHGLVIEPGDPLPVIPSVNFDYVILDGDWQTGIRVWYNSGSKSDKLQENYDPHYGEVVRLPSGSMELHTAMTIFNEGTYHLVPCGFELPGRDFLGWKVRVLTGGNWYWLTEEGKLIPKEDKTPVQKKAEPAAAAKPVIDDFGEDADSAADHVEIAPILDLEEDPAKAVPCIFSNNALLPVIGSNRIELIVADGVWSRGLRTIVGGMLRRR